MEYLKLLTDQILDSSEVNPRFYDLMFAGESQSAHRIENMESHGSSCMVPLVFFTFYVMNNRVRHTCIT